jgi:hypothetical protein
MWIAETSLNDSAQSPAWSRTPGPAATSASAARSWRASPAKTSGGTVASFSRAASARSSLGHSGWWSAGYERQDDGDQTDPVTAISKSV